MGSGSGISALALTCVALALGLMAHTQASVALAIALTLWYLAYQLWLMSHWLWLIALSLACSFDHVWRLSKQIFALQLAALAFQLGSSDSRRLLIQEFHPMRLHKGVSPCE
ncbi:hypothetical protein BD777DRAFT_149925 [Yarrowia lipolytica]|nr:hypothetical protein BD777DRAFT_149925 [Yarrowia lipolytica]